MDAPCCMPRTNAGRSQIQSLSRPGGMTIEEKHEQAPDSGASEADRVWAEFMAALDALPPAVRVAFLLHEVFETDYDAIARMTGLPATTCRRHIEYARAYASARMNRFGKKEQAPPP